MQATPVASLHRVVWDWKDDVSEDDPSAVGLDAQGRGRKTCDGTFIKSMVRGDCVSIWAWAFFPNWQNRVELAEIEIYFAI